MKLRFKFATNNIKNVSITMDIKNEDIYSMYNFLTITPADERAIIIEEARKKAKKLVESTNYRISYLKGIEDVE